MSARRQTGIPAALAALVGERVDVADVLVHLVEDCGRATGAAAVAVLAQDAEGRLALMATTSHRAEELELLQAQQVDGPCVEAALGAEAVTADSVGESVERWGDVGRALGRAGFTGVHAYPMTWRGRPVGGLNLYLTDPLDVDRDLAQAYADMATVVLISAGMGSHEQARARVQAALDARSVVEQAKGVLAWVEDVDMETAYQRLLELAERSGRGLTETAADVVRRRGRD